MAGVVGLFGDERWTVGKVYLSLLAKFQTLQMSSTISAYQTALVASPLGVDFAERHFVDDEIIFVKNGPSDQVSGAAQVGSVSGWSSTLIGQRHLTLWSCHFAPMNRSQAPRLKHIQLVIHRPRQRPRPAKQLKYLTNSLIRKMTADGEMWN